jgi:hypothetical protein
MIETILKEPSDCSPICPYYIDRLGKLNEPVCGYYKTVCSAAAEKCLDELKKQDVNKPYFRSMGAWPGINRGWGPITRKLEGE